MNDVRVVEVRNPEGSPKKVEELIKNCFKTAGEGWTLQEIREQHYTSPNSQQGTATFIGWLLILTK